MSFKSGFSTAANLMVNATSRTGQYVGLVGTSLSRAFGWLGRSIMFVVGFAAGLFIWAWRTVVSHIAEALAMLREQADWAGLEYDHASSFLPDVVTWLDRLNFLFPMEPLLIVTSGLAVLWIAVCAYRAIKHIFP